MQYKYNKQHDVMSRCCCKALCLCHTHTHIYICLNKWTYEYLYIYTYVYVCLYIYATPTLAPNYSLFVLFAFANSTFAHSLTPWGRSWMWQLCGNLIDAITYIHTHTLSVYCALSIYCNCFCFCFVIVCKYCKLLRRAELVRETHRFASFNACNSLKFSTDWWNFYGNIFWIINTKNRRKWTYNGRLTKKK